MPGMTSVKDTKESLLRKRKEKLAKAELESDKDEVMKGICAHNYNDISYVGC